MAETIIWDLQIGSNDVTKIASSAYGTCSANASTQNKAVTLAGFTQAVTGVTVHVKFDNINTASNPTLQIGTSNPYTIKTYGSEINTQIPTWPAGAVVSFTFDGTSWIMNSGLDTNTTYSIQNTYDDTSEDPISGKGVKAAIGTLDITTIENTAGKTVATITESDGIVGATFQDIAITESQVTNLTTDLAAKMPKSGGEFTGNISFANGTTITVNTPTEDGHAATKGYVDTLNAGLTGAMHYIPITIDENHTIVITKIAGTNGAPDKYTITGTGLPSNYTPTAGDVIIYEHQEYVYGNATLGWRLLGDEGSYAFKTNTADVLEDVTLSNSLPTLTITPTSIQTISSVGSIPTLDKTDTTVKSSSASQIKTTHMEVQNGTLKITLGTGTVNFSDVAVSKINSWSAGSTPSLGTDISVGSASGWSAGSGASITKSKKTVVVP